MAIKTCSCGRRGSIPVKRIYQTTQSFPTEEKFGLVSQLRRAAVSIPSNIAEGQARHTTREFIQFISYAEGSVAELETQLIIASELGYCNIAAIDDTFSSSFRTAEDAQLFTT